MNPDFSNIEVDVGKSSNLGLTLTDREGEEYHNRLVGLDGDFKFTKQDRFMFQTVGSNTKYPDFIVSESSDYDQPKMNFSGKAYRLFYIHNTRNYEIYGYQEDLDDNFRADLGFMTQVGYRYNEVGGTYKWRHDPGY